MPKHTGAQGAHGSTRSCAKTPRQWGEQEENTGVYHRGPTRANTSPRWALLQPGKGSFCSMGKAHPCGCSRRLRPSPAAPRERRGKGSGQAELLAAPAATNQRGTAGSVAHRAAEEQPEYSSTSQEGPPDPTHQDPTLQTCPFGRTQHKSIRYTSVALHDTTTLR